MSRGLFLPFPTPETAGQRRIYIAGPMRGLPEFNFPAFDAAARRFRKLGWLVYNPAEMDRVSGVHEFTLITNPQPFLREAMARDCTAICWSDAIGLLPGWQKSSGAGAEIVLGKLLGLEFRDAETTEVIHV